MSYLIGAAHYLQMKASDNVILQHITLSQFYTTVKICYAFSVCSYVKKLQNFKSDKIQHRTLVRGIDSRQGSVLYS